MDAEGNALKVKSGTGFECPDCAEFNHVRSAGKGKPVWLCVVTDEHSEVPPREIAGVSCPHCEEFIPNGTVEGATDDSRWVCEHCEEEPGEEEHEPARLWVMPDCGCEVFDEPEKVKRFICGECEGEWVEDRDEALECCRE